jgi:hypothetical protein
MRSGEGTGLRPLDFARADIVRQYRRILDRLERHPTVVPEQFVRPGLRARRAEKSLLIRFTVIDERTLSRESRESGC